MTGIAPVSPPAYAERARTSAMRPRYGTPPRESSGAAGRRWSRSGGAWKRESNATQPNWQTSAENSPRTFASNSPSQPNQPLGSRKSGLLSFCRVAAVAPTSCEIDSFDHFAVQRPFRPRRQFQETVAGSTKVCHMSACLRRCGRAGATLTPKQLRFACGVCHSPLPVPAFLPSPPRRRFPSCQGSTHFRLPRVSGKLQAQIKQEKNSSWHNKSPLPKPTAG